jgi:cytochrome P450
VLYACACRFSPEHKGGIDSYVYLPFGKGPRGCIGSHFALLEGKVLLATLARHFSFAMAKQEGPFARVFPGEGLWVNQQLTLRVKDGLVMKLQPRAASASAKPS